MVLRAKKHGLSDRVRPSQGPLIPEFTTQTLEVDLIFAGTYGRHVSIKVVGKLAKINNGLPAL